jgi:hypothetical protein
MDPFVGTWTLNRNASTFDSNHRPGGGTMRWERTAEGHYTMLAEGVDAKGERCVERPQTLIPDGQARPVPDLLGLTAVTTQPDARTLVAEVRREDGSLAGQGRYVVSEDGRSLVATTAGFDTQLRRFEMRTVWDRVPVTE